ncbi:MAG: MBL fold metallo-hydrolase [Akkermansia sp.]
MDRIHVFSGGIAACNGYLLKTGVNTYIAIDAPEGFTDWIQSKRPDAKITDLLITHHHFDHIMDAAKLKERFACTIHAHSAYSDILSLVKLAHDSWGMELKVIPFIVDDILDTKIHTAQWGGSLWHIHHVPGHSPDSLVYHLPDDELLFSGDTIFAGSIGRTDLPGGSSTLLTSGIEKKILTQVATTNILPGHGPYTTVKNEILTNPFLL